MTQRSNPDPADQPFAGLDQILCGDVLDVLAALCGDVLDVLAAIPPECVHLLITSPPYNLEKDYEQHSDDTADGVSAMLSAPA